LKTSIEELREVLAQRDSTIAIQRDEISSLESHIGSFNLEIDSLRRNYSEQLEKQTALVSVRNAEVHSFCIQICNSLGIII